MVIATNSEVLKELGDPNEGHEWLVDVDSPDFKITAQAIKGTFISLQVWTELDSLPKIGSTFTVKSSMR